jgi:hypothetical protein
MTKHNASSLHLHGGTKKTVQNLGQNSTHIWNIKTCSDFIIKLMTIREMLHTDNLLKHSFCWSCNLYQFIYIFQGWGKSGHLGEWRGGGHTEPPAWFVTLEDGYYPVPEQCSLAWMFNERTEFRLVSSVNYCSRQGLYFRKGSLGTSSTRVSVPWI